MARIENTTLAPLSFSILGEITTTKEYKTIIQPAKVGDRPEVVTHQVEEKSNGVIGSVLLPARIDDGGLLTLSKDELKSLKAQEGFMAACKRGDIRIRDHV